MLQQSEIEQYQQQGYLIINDCFNTDEIDALKNETEKLSQFNLPCIVYENDSQTVRSINGPHFISGMMARLPKVPRLLQRAKKLLIDELYVHQYKINIKRAFLGDVWEWHSDYWYWKIEDGMPSPQALTAVIFLDDVNDFNGPMLMVPGTHKNQLLEEHHTRPYGELDGGENWHITTSSKLKYQLTTDYLKESIKTNGLVAAKGAQGSVLFFDCNLLHCSSANPSPWDRRAIFISFNRVSNALVSVKSPRPDFMANRNFTPLTETHENFMHD